MNEKSLEEIKIDFGDYVRIEQRRYGVPNEMYDYKVIGGGSKSNSWVNVPVQTPAEEVLHDTMEDVIRCVCCGIDEREVLKFRVKDVILITPKSTMQQACDSLIEKVLEITKDGFDCVCYHKILELPEVKQFNASQREQKG